MRLVKEEVIGNAERITFNHPSVIEGLEVGDEVWLENAKMKVVVESVESDGVTCRITQGGFLGSRKSCIIPGKPLNIPYVSDKDREDIKYSCENGGEYLAISFVSNKENIMEIKELLKEYGREDLKIICKVESLFGVQNIREIFENSDGVMIGRGDLGSEVPPEEIPAIQKNIIRIARETGKIVIVATEMLETMMENNRPKRAEVSDIANAVFDGTDAVMLSGETTIGKYPIETLKIVEKIINSAEQDIEYIDYLNDTISNDITNIIAQNVTNAALKLKCCAIIAPTNSGYTARMMSRYRPVCPVIAVSPSEEAVKSLQLHFAVTPVLIEDLKSFDKIMDLSKKITFKLISTKPGDKIIITGGYPFNEVKYTNFMKIEEL
jgi:pyruvate kinase